MSNDDASQTPQPPEPAAPAPQALIHQDHQDEFEGETPTDESSDAVVNERDTSEDV